MSKMTVIQYPNPSLRAKAKVLRDIDAEVVEQVREMIETMRLYQGAGLAAPQVGWSVRLFIARSPDADGPRVFINPEIVASEGKQTEEEGCLSFGNLRGKVHRAQKVRLRAYDLAGREIDIEAVDIFARILQHENDHLNGRLFIDSLTHASRAALAGDLKEMRRRYTQELGEL